MILLAAVALSAVARLVDWLRPPAIVATVHFDPPLTVR